MSNPDPRINESEWRADDIRQFKVDVNFPVEEQLQAQLDLKIEEARAWLEKQGKHIYQRVER